MLEVDMMNFSLGNIDKAIMVPSCFNLVEVVKAFLGKLYHFEFCKKITIKTTKSLVQIVYNGHIHSPKIAYRYFT